MECTSFIKHLLGSASSPHQHVTHEKPHGVETLVQNRGTISKFIREAIDKATKLALAIFEWAKDHPVLVSLIALGVLVIIAPWVIEVLGFGELGPVAGTFASWWQARYAGYVSKGALFSFLQSLGMTWA
ncbi:hypothetical protein C8035_v008270 [Colletotrichum spinosum]|uniref:Uncharacterized protein n=1 Tax=Colletotrichum spinosum TaxID=1347390 RepID=A0A4V3HSQ7_9PEZI|nr:hypothetical protein C8035_v008270 [Colletotrichum spinosum]